MLFESVHVVAAEGNYGWRILEGTHCFDPTDNTRPPPGPCPTSGVRGEPLISPVVELGHDMGTAIVGGFVYRGSFLPELRGAYIFGAWNGTGNGGRILVATPPPGLDLDAYPLEAGHVTPELNRMWTAREVQVAGSPDRQVHAYVRGFGEDEDREVYVMVSREMDPDLGTTTGEVLRLVPAG